MNKPALLILAAGMGSRYGGLKQVSRFGPGGETILEYSIFDALRAGFDKIVIVVRRDFASEFEDSIIKNARKKAEISLVYQELDNIPKPLQVPTNRTKPWGTGHAILMAKNEINTPFAVINADDFYGSISFEILSDFLSSGFSANKPSGYCIVNYVLRNTLSESGSVARGICSIDKKGFLLDIKEHKNIYRENDRIYSKTDENKILELSGDEPVSMNMMGFTPDFFPFLNEQFTKFISENIQNPNAEYFLPVAVKQAMLSGEAIVRVLPTKEQWFGVTYPDDRIRVVNRLQELTINGNYPVRLWD